MNGIGAGLFGDADDFINAQISRHGAEPLADAIGLVGLETVQAEFVFFGVDSDRLFAHFIGRAHDANGDLATVGDQDFLELGHGVGSLI